ncbi:hypothetical protein R80B4_03008 [Fibrobacteres bacterium R8-0-B4]
MPKPMLKTPQQNQQADTLSAAAGWQAQKQQAQRMDKMKLDRLLRQTRSKTYMDTLRKLDAGGHARNQDNVNDIIDTLKNEFPDVELGGVLLGYVSKCYLGKPYEVHTLDVVGGIIEHYEAGRSLPNGMEKARSIAMRGGYDVIEVYVDCCRAVSGNGVVSVIPT